MDSRVRRPATHDERRVHLVVFVVEAECVQHEVYAESKRELPLLAATGHDRMGVVAEVVALVRASEILPRVDHSGTPATLDCFDVREVRSSLAFNPELPS